MTTNDDAIVGRADMASYDAPGSLGVGTSIFCWLRWSCRMAAKQPSASTIGAHCTGLASNTPVATASAPNRSVEE